MPKRLQPQAPKPDRSVESRGRVELLAAETDQPAEQAGPGKFRMVLYTGEIVQRYDYRAEQVVSVVLDVAGFSPRRTSDLPAMVEHWERAGTIDAIAANPADSTITATGRFLAADAELFPASARAQAILKQGHALQCSGRWIPEKIQKLAAGVKDTVNNQAVMGPMEIWRAFSIREGSFCDLGRDEMTHAEMAASSALLEPEPKENTMPKSIELIAALKPIFGADRAIDLCASKPAAEDLSAFAGEIAAHAAALTGRVTELETSVKTKDAEIGALKTELAASKAAPVVRTITSDPATPPGTPPAAGSDAELKAKYEASAELKAEFGDFERYAAFAHKSPTSL